MEVKLGPIIQKQLGVPEKKVQNYMTLEDLEKRWVKQRKWDKKHPVITFLKTIWWWIHYGIWNKIDDARYEVKWGFQRMFRGYDDPYVWGYWSENARLTIKALQHLRKYKMGFPVMLLNKNEKYNSKNDQKKYEKRWNDILDKMITGWEALLKEDTICYKTKNGKYDLEKSHKKKKELLKTWEKSMILYIKYYRSLWD